MILKASTTKENIYGLEGVFKSSRLGIYSDSCVRECVVKAPDINPISPLGIYRKQG